MTCGDDMSPATPFLMPPVVFRFTWDLAACALIPQTY